MQLGTDNFGRVVSPGLGTASDGQAWFRNAGTNANYTVSAGQGAYAYDSGTYGKQLLGYGVSQDFNIVCRFTPGSSTDFFGFMYRYNDVNNYCTAQINASGQYSATIFSGGTEYDYDSGGTTVTVVGGTPVWLRMAVTGTSIQLRYWNDGTAEPGTWGWTVTTAPTPWLGQYGLIMKVATAATSILIDNYLAINNISQTLNTVGGFIYPGSTAVGGVSDVPAEIADGRRLDRLEPEYWLVGNGTGGHTAGVLVEETVAGFGWDGYSTTNVSLVKAHSTEQFITVSGTENVGAGKTAISSLATDSTKLTNFCNTLVNFCTTNGLTGIGVDMERTGGWTSQATLWGQYKTIVTALGNALHTAGLKLLISGPAFTAQGSISWVWSDMNAIPADYLAPQVYDHFYDTITGGSANPGPDYTQSPDAWIASVITFMKTQIMNINQLVIAVTSEAYFITNNDTSFASVVYGSYTDAAGWTGFSGATRDKLSGELMWTNGGKVYVYCDEVTMNHRLQMILAGGVQNVDTWFFGGANKWYTVYPTTGGGGGGGGGSSVGITLTNAGRNLIRDYITSNLAYVAIGTGTSTPYASNSGLDAEVFRKKITSYSQGANPGEIIITMYLAPGDAVNVNIQEYGFFGGSATSAANSGTLFARGLYNHVHLGTEDIQFVLDFTE